MDKSKLKSLIEQKSKLNEDYRLVAIEKVTADDKFNAELARISGLIYGVDAEIRRLRTPVGE